MKKLILISFFLILGVQFIAQTDHSAQAEKPAISSFSLLGNSFHAHMQS